jgi:hypothetical protein
MRKVLVKLNNEIIGTVDMTTEEIKRAEYNGFTIIEK